MSKETKVERDRNNDVDMDDDGDNTFGPNETELFNVILIEARDLAKALYPKKGNTFIDNMILQLIEEAWDAYYEELSKQVE